MNKVMIFLIVLIVGCGVGVQKNTNFGQGQEPQGATPGDYCDYNTSCLGYLRCVKNSCRE